jgi:hypothetical protein
MRHLLLALSLVLCTLASAAQSQEKTTFSSDNISGSSGDGASSPAKTSSYLFVWAGELNVAGLKGGEGAKRGTDFLAVLDADPKHAEYGKLLAMLPVGDAAHMPHHTNYQMPGNGMLFANDYDLHKTFIFDLQDPQHPKIAGTFTEAGGYSHPHSFAYLPNGNTLATFQQKGLDDAAPGGLVELNGKGELIRAADAADPAEQFIRPYSLEVIPALDRVLSTSADMYLHGNSHVIQVWRLSDLKLLKTIVLPHGNYNALIGENSSEPRLLEDGRTVLVGTFNCGLYRLDGLEGTDPSATPVYDFGGRWCAVPAVAGHFWIEALQSSHSVVSLDISDPSHPVEVGRLTLGSEDLPHWVSVEPNGDRIVISGYGSLYYRLLMGKIDLKTGKLTLDEHFREPGGKEPGLNMDRQWPDGWNGPAIPHGAVFSLQ